MRRFQSFTAQRVLTSLAVHHRLCATESSAATVAAPSAATTAVRADAPASPKNTNNNKSRAAAAVASRIVLPPAFAKLKASTPEAIQKLPAAEVLALVTAFLRHKQILEKLVNEQRVTSPLGHRKFVAELRRATMRALPSTPVVRELFRRTTQMIDDRQISLSEAVVLISVKWPPSIAAAHRRATLMVTSWIIEALQKTLPHVQRQGEPATNTTAGEAAASRDAQDEGRSSAASSVPTPTAAQSEATIPQQQPSLLMTPSDARFCLRSLPHLLRANVALVGPLVTVAFQDLDSIDHPKKILGCLWAIENAKAHAPDSIWRRTTSRLWDMHRNREVVLTEGEKNAQVKTFLMTEDDATSGMTRVAVKRAGAAASRSNNKAAGKAASATTGATESGIENAKQPPKAHRGLSVREIFRLLRVLKRERWCGDAAILRGFINDALRIIARNDGALRDQGKTSRGTVQMQRRVRQVADLKPNEFLSLCIIAGELGVGFGQYLDAMDETMFAPVIRYHNNFMDIAFVTEMLRKTRCHNAVVFQALIDRMRKQGVHNPLALDLTLSLGKCILPHSNLLNQLRFGPFLELIEVVASHAVKMNARMLVSYTDLIFQLIRKLSRDGPHAQVLLRCVDEFAIQMERLLANGIAPVERVNVFLELTMVLGMRKPNVAAMYPHSAKLAVRRNLLYKETRASDMPFAGIVNGNVSTGQIYHKVYYLTKHLSWMRVRVPQSQLDELYSRGMEYGLLPIFSGVKKFRDVHYRRVVHHSPDAAVTSPSSSSGTGKSATTTTAATPLPIQSTVRALDRPIPPHVDRVILQSMLKVFDMFNAPVRDAPMVPTYVQGLHQILGVPVVDLTHYNLFLAAIDRAPLPLTKRHPKLWLYVRHLGMSLKIDEETQNRVDRLAAKYTV